MNISNLKSLLLLFWIFQPSLTFSQTENSQKNYSPFGKVLTPKGDLKILLIYAGFKGYDGAQNVGQWNDASDLPPWDGQELFYKNNLDFETDTLQRANNISRFYFTSSNPKQRFRITADVLPTRINIDPSSAGSFNQCNRLVMEQFKQSYPNFDWKPYDNRTNMPGYKFDNSKSEPDHQPDYVIIAYRYWVGWNPEPKSGMRSWATNFSRLDGLSGFEFNGFTFDGSGFTMANFDGRLDSFRGLFLHEFAHELFSCPHYSGANGATGNYLNLPSMGWDMMNQTGGNTCNAFEKWVLGWTDIRYDLKDMHDNGVYELHDIETKGESIRIKIPHTQNQFLWIENRELIHPMDHKPWRNQLKNQPQGSKGIPDKEPGVYMFIESVLNDRHAIHDGLVYDMNKVNGIYPLHAEGNFDYNPPEQYTMRPEEYWNNKLYWFERHFENPISGLNPYINYRGDMDASGAINNIPKSFGAFNGMADTESFPIIKEVINGNPVLTYANTGGRNEDALPFRRSDAFQKGDMLGIGSNPVVINRPFYNWQTASLDPYFLNGISITILERNNGVAKIKIHFNDTDINENTRWCGNLILKKVDAAKKGFAANLAKSKILTINLSGIPNKHLPPFVNPSNLTIDSGAVLNLSEGSELRILEGSLVRVKAGGQILLGKNSKIVLDKTSHLIIEPGGLVELEKSSTIESTLKEGVDLKIPTGINRSGNIKITGK